MDETDLLRFSVPEKPQAGIPPVWDPMGKRLAVVTQGGLVTISLQSAEVSLRGEPRAGVRSVAWSPDGKRLAVAYDGCDLQQLLCAATGEELWKSSIGETAVDEVVWSSDGQRIAYVGDALVVCAADTGAVLWRFEEKHARQISHIATHLDGGQTRVVEHVRFDPLLTPCCEALWSPDARLLMGRWEKTFRVLGALDGDVKADGEVTRGILRWTSWGEPLFRDGDNRLVACTSRITDSWARTLTFSPDGQFAAVEGKDHCLWVQDTSSVRAFDGHPRTITAITWSSRGTLATACRDGAVRMLSPADSEIKMRARFKGIHSNGLAWSTDGRFLAVCCGDAVVVLSAIR